MNDEVSYHFGLVFPSVSGPQCSPHYAAVAASKNIRNCPLFNEPFQSMLDKPLDLGVYIPFWPIKSKFKNGMSNQSPESFFHEDS